MYPQTRRVETLGLRTKAVLNCFLGFLEHQREGRRFTSFTATRSLEEKVVQNASGWVKCPTLGVRWGALEAVCVGGGCVCFICAENAAADGPGGGSGCPAESAGFLLLSDSCRGRAACCLLRGGGLQALLVDPRVRSVLEDRRARPAPRGHCLQRPASVPAWHSAVGAPGFLLCCPPERNFYPR